MAAEKKMVVLYVAMTNRLLGIDLDTIEEDSRSYKYGSGVYPSIQNPICDFYFADHGLPNSMAVAAIAAVDDNHQPPAAKELYLVGGEYPEEKEVDDDDSKPRRRRRRRWNLILRPYRMKRRSPVIYRLDEPSSSLKRTAADDGTSSTSSSSCFSALRVGFLFGPKVCPIIETMGGKTYVLTRSSPPVLGYDGHLPSPHFELLYFVKRGDHSSLVSTRLMDIVYATGNNGCRFSGVFFHYVVGSRIFLLYSGRDEDELFSVACLDGALAEWIRINSDEILSSLLPGFTGGRSVSVCGGDDGDVGAIGNSGHHVLLFTTLMYEDSLHEMRYYTGIVTDSGLLICYQDITEDIFKTETMPEYMSCPKSHFTDVGGGRVYAMMSGYASDYAYTTHNVLCVSEFSIHKLTIADQIISEGSNARVEPKEVKFVDIVSVKNYICGIKSEGNHEVIKAFVL